EAPDVRLAEGGLRRVRGVAVREGHARAGAVRQRLRDGGLPEDPPALRRLPDAPELPDQEGGGGSLIPRCPYCGGTFEWTRDLEGFPTPEERLRRHLDTRFEACPSW